LKLEEVKKRTEITVELVAGLESGHSEVLTACPGAMAKFPSYSLSNITLIGRQKVQKPLFVVLLAITFFSGCNAINPLCRSARPKPVLTSLEPNPATLVQVQEGLLLTIKGNHFYSDSIVLWNGAALATTVISATQLQATITATQISSPGTAEIVVHTPANLSGDLGCDSGGNSAALTFTVT
jgi:IPT/TIG domain-containing protein